MNYYIHTTDPVSLATERIAVQLKSSCWEVRDSDHLGGEYGRIVAMGIQLVVNADDIFEEAVLSKGLGVGFSLDPRPEQVIWWDEGPLSGPDWGEAVMLTIVACLKSGGFDVRTY